MLDMLTICALQHQRNWYVKYICICNTYERRLRVQTHCFIVCSSFLCLLDVSAVTLSCLFDERNFRERKKKTFYMCVHSQHVNVKGYIIFFSYSSISHASTLSCALHEGSHVMDLKEKEKCFFLRSFDLILFL